MAKQTAHLADNIEEALGRVSVTHRVDAETIRGYVEQLETRYAPEDLSLPAVKLARRVQALPDDAVYAIVLFKMRTGELVYVINCEGKLERAG